MDPRTLLAAAAVALATACAEWRHWPPGKQADPSPAEASAAEELVAAPEEIAGERVLGAKVLDPARSCVATIEDLLVDPHTGLVVAAVVALEGAGGELHEEVLAYGALDWRGDGDGVHAILVHEDALDLSVEGSTDPFDGRELARFEGEIVDVRSSSASNAVVKVRDDQNLLHCVRVGAAPLVQRTGIALEPGLSVGVEGVQTRDEKGKLWIACSLVQDDTSLLLRDAEGHLQWRTAAVSLVPASRLAEASAGAADGSVRAVDGWRLDPREGAVFTFARVDGEDRAIPWEEIRRAAADR